MKQGAAAAIFVAATIAAVDRRPVHAGAQLELVAVGRICEEADAASPLLLRDAVGRNWLLVPFVAVSVPHRMPREVVVTRRRARFGEARSTWSRDPGVVERCGRCITLRFRQEVVLGAMW